MTETQETQTESKEETKGVTQDNESLLSSLGDDAESTESRKPDYLPDNAWDDENKSIKADILAEEFQKANKRVSDLRKKLSQKGVIPKDAEGYEMPEFEEESSQRSMVDNDKGFIPFVKEMSLKHGINQEQFKGIISDSLEWLSENQERQLSDEEKEAYRDAEIDKLGTNGRRVINSVTSWANGQYKSGYLSESDLETISWWASTAEGVQLLAKMQAKMGGEEIPMDTVVDEGLPSDAQIAKMIGSEEYRTDAAFRKKVDGYLDMRQKAGRPLLLQTG